MIKKMKNLFLILIGSFVMVGFLGWSWSEASPLPSIPTHGWLAKHDDDDDDGRRWYKHKRRRAKRVYYYNYYPAQQVYYSPARRVYYYQNAGAWTYAPTLPPTIRLGNKVSISLGTPMPYTVHPTVIQTHPVIVVP